MRFLRSNSLAIVLAVFFLASIGGQSYSGWKSYDDEQRSQHQPTVSYTRYLVSSDFYDDVMSNWQSEFLQISLYVMFAVWFRQRGSAESQDPEHPVRDSDADEMLGDHLNPNSPKWARLGGCRLRIYENSLLIAMGVLFFLSWLAMAVPPSTTSTTPTRPHITRRRLACWASWGLPTSGTRRFRTGSRNSSRWESSRWRRSICDSAGRRSPSVWVPHTMPRALRPIQSL